jgi:hypothetical protein
MSGITLKAATKYYKKDKRGKLADEVIMGKLKGSKEIVYGARSVNAVVPLILKRHTDDWDIYTEDNPRTVAQKIEQTLDKRYGDNYFSVAPAKHQGTYKIKSRVTGREVADVTLKESEVGHRRIGGINYASLDYQVNQLKSALKKEESKFRHTRDKETLQRIKVYISLSPERKVTGGAKKAKITARTGIIK